MTTESTETLSQIWYEFWQRSVRENLRAVQEYVLQKIVQDLRAVEECGEDAIVYTMALRLDGGMIAQLTESTVDPGWVNRRAGATEGFCARDYCGAAWRTRRGKATAVRTYTPEEFLARDSTGTLAQRAEAFENALKAHLRSLLNS